MLCPPYDVISAAERDRLIARDPCNAVRLELPSATPASATDEDFAAAAATLRQWLDDGTLVRDERPMLYVCEQHFAGSDGAARVARSFLCELRLESYGPDSGVRPHEHTLGPAKEHRYRLLSETRTHLSPVLLLYEADTRALLDEVTGSNRPRESTAPDGTRLRLWAVDSDSAPAARDLLALAGSRPLAIADGHHRYETALRYRDTPGSPQAADHVLAMLFSSVADGLALAPWHRVIAHVADAPAVLAAASDVFDASPVDSAEQLLERVSASERAGVLGIWTRSGGALLEVDRARVTPFVAEGGSEVVRSLDVSVLSGTLGRMIGTSEAGLTAEGRLSYTHDAREAIRLVDEGHADVTFILRPTPADQLLAVAAAGDFMPPKSTYFYPKAATGLVFDPLF